MLGGTPLDVVVEPGVTLRGESAGPADGPPTLLLHGFPESRLGWRLQFGPLAAAGLRVAAPDQRGYGDSDKPRPVSAYRVERLVADALAVIDALGTDRARVVGHDWGALVAWCLAAWHPERVERLAVLNVPHPDVMRRRVMRDPRQMLRSWYALTFQLPWLPEAVSAAGNGRLPASMMRGSSRPGTFEEADLDRYREVWSRPGAWRAMIHWYRAVMRHPPRLPDTPVEPPTLVLWGSGDRFLREVMAEESVARCRDGRLLRFPDCTHWLQHEEPEQVNAALLDFLR